MSRHFKIKKSISLVVAFAILLSMFCGAVPVWSASQEGIYQLTDLNRDGTFEGIPDEHGMIGGWFVPPWTNNIATLMQADEEHDSAYMKLESYDGKNGDLLYGWIPVDYTKRYRIKFDAKIIQGVLTLYLYEIAEWKRPNPNGTPADPEPPVVRQDFPADESSNEWKEYEFIYKPNKLEFNGGVKKLADHIDIYFSDWSDGDLIAYIDNVTIEEFSTAPVITLNQPDESEVLNDTTFTVSGKVSDPDDNLVSVKVNGSDVVIDDEGNFSIQVTLVPGDNTITVTATDEDELVTEKVIKVKLIIENAPEIIIDQNDKNEIKNQKTFTVSGKVTDKDNNLTKVEIKVNDEVVEENITLDSEGKFEKTVNVKLGDNVITITAKDSDNNETVKSILVVSIPEKTDQPYDVGIYYFSNWNPLLSPHMIVNTKNTYGRDNDWFGGVKDNLLSPGPWGHGPHPDREPLIGWYDDRQQEVLDTHILQAASRGIDHFCFYYYFDWDGSKPRGGQNVELWKTSPYRYLMDYYLCFVADGGYGEKEWRENIVPKLIEFMKEPYYKKVKSDDPEMDGRPILGFFGDMLNRLGGTEEKSRENLQYLRDKCIEEGLKNPLLLVDGYRTLSTYIRQGYDGFQPLNLAGIGLDDNKGIPEDYSTSYPVAWREFVRTNFEGPNSSYEYYLFIPGGLNSFDRRPWRGVAQNDPGSYQYADPTPSKFKAQLDNVIEYLEEHPSSMNMATFYAWNEWGEGGNIEPNTLFGYGYLDIMQETFGLDNTTYKLMAADRGLPDIAPDVRVSVEPQDRAASEGKDVVLKVRVKNYLDESVAGTLTLNQPEKNAEGIDQDEWEVSQSSMDFELEAGEARDYEFIVTVGEGENWTRHNFIVTASYGGQSQDISTFIVKVPPFYGHVEKDDSKSYNEYKFDLNVIIRNYTYDPKTVDYTLELPEGWTADRLTDSVELAGYSGTGVHYGRTVTDKVVISYPEDTEPGRYQIKLTTTDGEFTKTDAFEVTVSELFNLLYNGSMELDEDNNGMPDVWSPGAGGGNITVMEGTVEEPAPKGRKYVKVTNEGLTGKYDVGYIQEGTKAGVHWLEINPNKTYELSFWAKVEQGKMYAIDAECQYDYTWLGWNSMMEISAEENGNEWKHYSFTFKPNPKAGRISVRFYTDWESEEVTIFYLDGVMLREVEPVTPPVTPPETPPVTQPDKPESVTREGNVNKIDNEVKDGKAAVDLSDAKPEDIFEGAEEDENGIQVVKYVFMNTEDANEYSLKLPAEALNDSAAGKMIVIETGLGEIALPSNMLSGIDTAAADDFEITLKKVDASELSDEVKAIVGDRPVISISVSIGGQNVDWSNDSAYVLVSLQYEPTDDELNGPGGILAYYIDNDGNIIPITLSMYNAEEGKVKFMTNHFSRFAVGYASRTFDDLGKTEWARKEIEALAARGVIDGIGNNLYAPLAFATRGEFVKLLVKAFGLEAEFDENFTDVTENDFFYNEAGIAKALGLIKGYGDGRFGPNDKITREDMVVILSRLLDMKGKDFEKADLSELDKFADKSEIASYSKEVLASFVKNEIIKGYGDFVNPKGNTNRAEMAVILYRILAHYVK